MTAPTPPKDYALTVGGWLVAIGLAIGLGRLVYAITELLMGG